LTGKGIQLVTSGALATTMTTAAISHPFLFICMRLRLSLTLEFPYFNRSVRGVKEC
jgi:hypothetical protein